MVFGLSLYSVSWTLTVLITEPPEVAELDVEAVLFSEPPPQPPETAATTTTTAPSREYRCVLIAGLRRFSPFGFRVPQCGRNSSDGSNALCFATSVPPG